MTSGLITSSIAMKVDKMMIRNAVRAHATGTAAAVVDTLVATLRDGLADSPAGVVFYFASSDYDPIELAGPLSTAFDEAVVAGCSTAGEFTDELSGVGGVAAIALPASLVTSATGAVADLADGAERGIANAVSQLEETLGVPLRELDPETHVGFVLIDGVHGDEEDVNDALGIAAPLLNVVGGSAGDDLKFADTWVAVGDHVSHHGAALLVCASAVPFTVLKTCTFTPTGTQLTVTKADLRSRIVHEFDGRPATAAYAQAVGVPVEGLDPAVFSRHSLGVMVDDEPFIRSIQAVSGDSSLQFYCQLPEGTQTQVMEPADIVTETLAAYQGAKDAVGGSVSGAVLFNCILRRVELDADGDTQKFAQTFDAPVAGFHSYGESWLGHMNQTLTGVVFGA